MQRIKTRVEALYEEMVAWRRDFHAHPELSNREFRTSGIIAEKLREFGLDSVQQICNTAVIGLLHGTAGPGKCIALRADIDALPVTEDTGLPFASETPGVMHACGHDSHIAMLLAAAKVLSGMRDAFSGTVKFIFQPAEEKAPQGGARPLVAAGVMENPHVDAIISCHVYPSEGEVGKIALYKGVATTSFDLYDIDVIGKAGHGSQPHTANDAILAASQFVVMLQQIVSRKIDPLKTAIVSVGLIKGGSAVNIIPGDAQVGMVVRAYDEEARATARQQVYDIAKGIQQISGCKLEVTYTEGYGSVVNNAAVVDVIDRACAKVLGNDGRFYLDGPLSFSEDFSYYGNATGTPSALVLLYAGHLGDEVYSLHNPRCTWKEEAMKGGVAALAASAAEFLQP